MIKYLLLILVLLASVSTSYAMPSECDIISQRFFDGDGKRISAIQKEFPEIGTMSGTEAYTLYTNLRKNFQKAKDDEVNCRYEERENSNIDYSKWGIIPKVPEVYEWQVFQPKNNTVLPVIVPIQIQPQVIQDLQKSKEEMQTTVDDLLIVIENQQKQLDVLQGIKEDTWSAIQPSQVLETLKIDTPPKTRLQLARERNKARIELIRKKRQINNPQ